MANLSFLKRQILPLSLFLFLNAAFADAESDAQKAIDDGNAMITAAKTEYEKKERECYEKVLVNFCLDAAQKELKEKTDAGKALKLKGSRALREIKKSQNEKKRAEQNEKIRRHEEKLKGMEVKTQKSAVD